MEKVEKKQKTSTITIILVGAPLKIATIGKDVVLLNSADHKKYIRSKLGMDPFFFRPDVLHQSLLTVLDSPLNKSGNLKVFVRTFENVLIKIDASIKIPRTFSRFSGLFAQLLKNLKIRAINSSTTLLKIIKNPVTDHIPLNLKKFGLSTKGKKVKIREFVKKLGNQEVVYVVGAVAKGNPAMECDFIDESICISSYGLSASNCLFKIVQCYEDMYDIE